MCQNSACLNRNDWNLELDQCSFTDWQKLRVQENSKDIPTGSMPRTMDIIVREEMVEKMRAGDSCVFVGYLITVPDLSNISGIGKLCRLRI